MRRNGFQSPLELLQIASWILFVIMIVGSFFLLYPFIESPWNYIYLSLIIILIIVVISYAVLATAIDPKDKCVDKDDKHLPCFCYLCNAHVYSTTKHCRACNKCIAGFDHHCKWLNTCVGSMNYNYFLGLLVSTCIMTLFNMIISIYIIIRIFTDPLYYRTLIQSTIYSIDYFPQLFCAILLVVYVIINLLPFLYIAQLLCFHIKLMYLHETTYSFLVKQEKKERERKAQEKVNRSKREVKKYNNKENNNKEKERERSSDIPSTVSISINQNTKETGFQGEAIMYTSNLGKYMNRESSEDSGIHRDSSSSSFFLTDKREIRPSDLNADNPLSLSNPSTPSTKIPINPQEMNAIIHMDSLDSSNQKL
ncbi:hypothetical protein WA158_000121 [Blastocystis sp. Blastoise]